MVAAAPRVGSVTPTVAPAGTGEEETSATGSSAEVPVATAESATPTVDEPDAGSPTPDSGASSSVSLWTLRSEPPGAVIYGPDRARLGTTPLTLPSPAERMRVTLHRAGCRRKKHDVEVGTTGEVIVRLARERPRLPSSSPGYRAVPLPPSPGGDSSDSPSRYRALPPPGTPTP